MSREVFEIVLGMDIRSIEIQLALQCAPLITGLKISNLLIVPVENVKLVTALLKKSRLSYYKLLVTEQKAVFLLFRRKCLEAHISDKKVEEFLRAEQYADFTLGCVLRTFQMRYQAHMEKGGEFPHEMGILLGYPLGDVKGFIENRGQNFLYSGYWKVYGNLTETVRLFERFECAKETLLRLLDRGISMEEIIGRIQYE